MPSIGRLLLTALPLVTYSSALVADLREDLKEVSEDSIRAALEQTLASKYQDGVFEHQGDAIEALHSENPQLASKVVDVAKHDSQQKMDMIKRQNNATSTVVDTTVISTIVSTITQDAPAVSSSTTTTTPAQPRSTSSETPSSAVAPTAHNEQSQSGLLVPTILTTSTTEAVVQPTNNNNSPSQQTTEVVVPVTISTQAIVTSVSGNVVVPVTTTNAQGAAVTTSNTVPAVPVTTTDKSGNVITTMSPVSSVVAVVSLTTRTKTPMTTTDQYGESITLDDAPPGATISTTDHSGRPVVITVTPGHGVASAVVLRTTTFPNGVRSTITSFAVAGGDDGTPTSAATSVTPTLPGGNAAATKHVAGGMVALVGGAIGAVALL